MTGSPERDRALEPLSQNSDDPDFSRTRFHASPVQPKSSKRQTAEFPEIHSSNSSTDSVPSTSLARSLQKSKLDQLPSRQQNVTVSARTIIFVIGVIAFSVYGFVYSSVTLHPFKQHEEETKDTVRFRKTISPDYDQDRRQILHRIEESARATLPCLFDPNVVCRFDSIGKFLEDSPPIPNIVHRLLQSVPSYRRTPHDKANDRDYQVKRLSNNPNDRKNLNASNSTLNEYNPTIFPLYKTIIHNGTEILISDLDDKLLDELTGRYHPGFTDAQADEVKYLQVTRSTNHYPRCVGFKKHKDKGYDWVNYPGLVLLDENLMPIDGADVVIDIEKYYFTDTNTRMFQDFTLYAARTTKSNPKKDHIFLITNGMFVIPMAIRRVPPETQEANDPEWKTKISQANLSPEYMYGTGLQVKMTRASGQIPSMFFVRAQPSVRILKGKNVHFFEGSNGNNYVEVWPYNAHTVRKVNFFIDNFTTFGNYEWLLTEEIITPEADDRPSFRSEPTFLPMQNPVNRGTGCCADLTLSDGLQVKIGIAHSVLKGLSYLHRFYAFVPKYPFEVIKLSGLFCLGHMRETDGDVQSHWLSQKNGSFDIRNTYIGEETYNCPDISFASGITNMVGFGNEYIIISYGVDDCYSRSIIVHKKKIELLMFRPKANATNVLYQ